MDSKKNVVRVVNFNDISNAEKRVEIDIVLKKISAMLHFANRTRQLSIGLTNSLSLNPKKIGVVLISDDLGESSKQKVIQYCSDETPIYLFDEASNYPNDMFYSGKSKKGDNKEDVDKSNKKIKVITIQKSEFSKKINEDIIRI